MIRKITFLTLFLWLMTVTFPVIAQQKTDTTYTFRFVPKKDMFYVPWNGNDTELARLLECIENSKATIFNGKLPLLVDGYCNSLGGEAENLATAKIRANRVKSELITRAKIKEENFITHNHATGGDFVIVRLTVPAKETAAMDAEAEARRRASTITTNSIRLSLVGAQVDWMMKISPPRTFSLICTLTSPSLKRPTAASPSEVYRRLAIRCASSGVALPAKSFISGTRRTSGMRPLVERICRTLCGPGMILSRRCIKERDATSGTR